MEDLRWILLGLGGLVLLGLYLFSRKRRDGAVLPFGDELKHDPLEAAPAARRPESKASLRNAGPGSQTREEPIIEDITHWGDDGVGPVRRRTLEEDAVRPPRPSQRRTPRFGYEAAPRSSVEQLPLDEITPAPSPGPIPVAADSSASPAKQDMDAGREREQDEPKTSQASGVVPVYLVARDPQGLAGTILIDAFARHGFEFGEMDVYHHADVRGHILFSLMNGVAPGTFDPVTLPEQATPALALFLRLPIPAQPGLVFEQFLDIAHRLADELDATLLDERREELSSESIDRMREIALGE